MLNVWKDINCESNITDYHDIPPLALDGSYSTVHQTLTVVMVRVTMP